MTQMCDPCYDAALAAMGWRHSNKSNRQLSDFPRTPASMKWSPPKASSGPRLSTSELFDRAEMREFGRTFGSEPNEDEVRFAAQMGVSLEDLKAQKKKDREAQGLHLSHAERRSQLQADMARSGITLTNEQADEALRTAQGG